VDQLKAIECFIAVAETGSFSRAAEQLNRPVSSVSRQVTALEEMLQAELLYRSTRQIRLTEVGQFYLQQCQDITGRLERAREHVNDYQREPSGTLVISAMTAFGERVLVPLIEEFQSLYPRILVEAEFTDEVRDLSLTEIDLCFRGGALPDKRLIARKVMDNNFHPCASPEYLAENGRPTDTQSLELHKGVFYRAPNGILPWWISDQDGDRHCNLEPAVITNSATLLVNHLLRGKGIGMLPLWVLRPYLNDGRLEMLKMDNPPRISPDESMGIYMLYQQMRYQIPKVRCAVDFFRERLADWQSPTL